MFANCRKYNEEGSMIYDDAMTLQKVLLDRVKELGPLPDPPPRKSTPRMYDVFYCSFKIAHYY